jgi:hypothetical protein
LPMSICGWTMSLLETTCSSSIASKSVCVRIVAVSCHTPCTPCKSKSFRSPRYHIWQSRSHSSSHPTWPIVAHWRGNDGRRARRELIFPE